MKSIATKMILRNEMHEYMELMFPINSEILAATYTNGMLFITAQHDANEHKQQRYVIIWTAKNIMFASDNWRFLNTIAIDNHIGLIFTGN